MKLGLKVSRIFFSGTTMFRSVLSRKLASTLLNAYKTKRSLQRHFAIYGLLGGKDNDDNLIDSFQKFMKTFEKEKKRFEKEVKKSSWLLKSLYEQAQEEGSPGETIHTEIDVSAFKPEDVTVEVKRKVLKITAKSSKTIDGKTFEKEMVREIVLPEKAKSSEVKTSFTDKGTLLIEIPVSN